jgi:hypothetical protein
VSPPYVAVSKCIAGDNVVTARLAVLPDILAVPTTAEPSLKVTVPVILFELELTVAFSVTG